MERVSLLKITQRVGDGRRAILKLEGVLSGPWVDELRRSAEDCRAAGWPVLQLDLSAVRYADAQGETLLRQLIVSGIEICACSKFVAALLGRQSS